MTPQRNFVGLLVAENCVTVVATAALIGWLYSLGAGGHSFWGLLMLINLNSPRFTP